MLARRSKARPERVVCGVQECGELLGHVKPMWARPSSSLGAVGALSATGQVPVSGDDQRDGDRFALPMAGQRVQ